MEKLNIAEILKDFPKGMELDCLMYDNVTLDSVSTEDDYPIRIVIKNNVPIRLTKYGQNLCIEEAKCVIFPKGKTTWDGFQRPFKDGDVVVCVDNNEDGKEEATQIFILKSQTNENRGFCYTGYDFKRDKFFDAGNWCIERLATEEEKEKLFDAIRANGYKWNPETKTLEKLIVPKFKVGDKIKVIYKTYEYVIKGITDTHYTLEEVEYKFQYTEPIIEDKNWELVPNKFDITTLKPFESRVLVRSSMDGLWKPAVFGFRNGYNDNAFYIVGGSCWKQCIPYLNNEHLCGTTNDCDDFYKTWE